MKRADLRWAVLRIEGTNSEDESVRVLRETGVQAEAVHLKQLTGDDVTPDERRRLSDFDGLWVAGGFSAGDYIRAGAILAARMKSRLGAELKEFVEAGKPVLGICNGAQVLVECGLVPSGAGVELALARNRMPGRSGYQSRWIYTRTEPSPCVFTKHLPKGTMIPLQVGHGEGRFVSHEKGRITALKRSGQAPLLYATPAGHVARAWPDNPSGSDGALAAVCNETGNVLAMMPHPDRAQSLGALPPSVVGAWHERREAARVEGGAALATAPGPGLLLFDGLRRHLEVVQ